MARPFKYNNFKTTDAALEYLEELVSSIDDDKIYPSAVFIEMPDPGAVSGEDDAEEDEGGTGDDLQRSILLQPCELRIGNEEEDDASDIPILSAYGDIANILPDASNTLRNVEQTITFEAPKSPSEKRQKRLYGNTITESDASPSCSTHSSASNVPKKIPHLGDDFQWKADKKSTFRPCFPAPDYRDCVAPAWELFERFFDDDMLNLIATKSNEYGVANDNMNPEITLSELRVLIGIMLISGYSHVGDMKSYWCTDSDLYNKMIATAMTRDRFSTISKNIHFTSPSEINPIDKMWKLRPVTDRFVANCLKNFHPEQDLSYDESMIPYYGRHGCKQFIRGKPIRFGYKVWCSNTPLGYLVNFEIYQGKNPRVNPILERNFGKCVAPLLEMIHMMPPDMKSLRYCFFFDNLFTGVPVLSYLKHLGYDATGTIRERRIPRNCPLPKNDKIKKMPRGTYYSKVISKLDIGVTKWMDNSVVCIASTLFGANPVEAAKRYSRETHSRISVPRPNVFREYNKAMGGTDRMDQNIAYYRVSTRKKKWWWSIFTYLIDVGVQNAWILHKKGGGNLSQKQFRRNIASHYCNKYADIARIQKGRKKYNISDADIRFDGICHYVGPSATRRRCAYQFCKSTSRLVCKKCDVGLCPNCFEKYHTLAESQ